MVVFVYMNVLRRLKKIWKLGEEQKPIPDDLNKDPLLAFKENKMAQVVEMPEEIDLDD